MAREGRERKEGQGSLKISLSCSLFGARYHLPMGVSFTLGNAVWYCVTKGSIFFGAVALQRTVFSFVGFCFSVLETLFYQRI